MFRPPVSTSAVAALAALSLVAACGPGTTGSTDAARQLDADATPTDMGTLPDLVYDGMRYRFVIDRLIFPSATSGDGSYAFDLNGSGAKNQFARLSAKLDTLTQSPAFLQSAANVSLRSYGDSLNLLVLGSHDATFARDDMSILVGYVAQTRNNPDLLTGKGFQIDRYVPSEQLSGGLFNGRFNSSDPSRVTADPILYFRLGFAGNTTMALSHVDLPLHAVHLSFTVKPDPNDASRYTLSGQINGAIKASDLQGLFLPTLAQYLTKGTSPSVVAKFDVDRDGTITADELQAETSPILATLKPDVQLFDANGNYAPRANNTDPDSYSIGLGFTAITANFSE